MDVLAPIIDVTKGESSAKTIRIIENQIVKVRYGGEYNVLRVNLKSNTITENPVKQQQAKFI